MDTGAGLMSFGDVEARLVEAWSLFLRLPDREKGWQRVKANWPDTLRHNHFGDYGDMDPDARPRPPGLYMAEVDRMEEALGWVGWVKPRDRKLVGHVLGYLQRAPRPDWTDIAFVMRFAAEPDALRKRYSRAITAICNRLNSAEMLGVERVKG